MLLSAARYSYANARVRALRSRRLTGEDFHFLLQAEDLTGLLTYLATTAYGRFRPGLSLKRMERGLHAPLFAEYRKIATSLSRRAGRGVILALFARFEAENLKILLRRTVTGLEHTRIAPMLYPLGSLSRLAWDRLSACESLREIIQATEGTIFARPLANGLPLYETTTSLFPLETALDLAVFRDLAAAVDHLAGKGVRKAARRVVGGYVDILNCLWVIRLRRHFRLSPEEIVNYTLPGGSDISLSDLHRLAKADTVSRFLELLPSSLASRLGALQDWSGFPPALDTILLHHLRRTLASFPFHVGVQAGYLLEKELEVRAVITIMEGKAQKLTPETIASHLPGALFRETAHV
ncbi:V0D/AC39 family V-type ATPase subunit [Thermodesulfobacteriota bacterium B35]